MRRVVVVLIASAAVAGASVAAAKTWPPSGSGLSADRSPVSPTDASRSTTTTSTASGSTTTSTSPTVPRLVGFSTRVSRENGRPGSGAWAVSKSSPGVIEGYTTSVSAEPGEPVGLAVSTGDPSFHVEAYRMGSYQGLGGRLVWQSAELPGQRQAKPAVNPGSNLVEAQWRPSLTVPTARSWPAGDYLLKLVGSSGNQQLVPLTLRDDKRSTAILVINAVTTWQAYNTWGGCSLYICNSGKGRAQVVSFDRPYALGEGTSDFAGNELPLIRRLEGWGLDVSYATDVDVHRDPGLLLDHRAVLSMGHDEYWSKSMRDGMEAARDHGVNLAFLGANAAYRQIRLGSSPNGPNRHEIDYRSTADPIRSQDPGETTVSWRQAPVNRPEATLIGQQYECNPVEADLVVSDPTSWVFAGTGVTLGQRLPSVVGSEYDRWSPGAGVPPNVQILAHSPVTCGRLRSFSDMTYYSAPSGAGVFATGTNNWVSRHALPGPGSLYDATVVQITLNVLQAFAGGPAGAIHPSMANAAVINGRGRP